MWQRVQTLYLLLATGLVASLLFCTKAGEIPYMEYWPYAVLIIITTFLQVMALTTYLIRVIPFAAVRGKIRSRFINSVLYYIPYAVLSAMTFPAIFYATGNTLTASVGTVVALLLAYFEVPLIVVALSSSAVAFITGLIIGIGV